MKHLLATAAAALLLAGPAGAATPVIEFSPEVQFSLAPKAPAAMPSADVPNGGGSLRLPDAFTTPPARRAQLGFPALHSLWQRAGAAYGIPWQVLASINRIETNFGQNMGPSSAGAVGWMQFMPSTWLRWGMDADGDGVADPWNPEDAIFSAARYLAAAGGATDLQRAIFAYNHAQWYVDEVLAGARLYGGGAAAPVGFSAVPSAEIETAEAAIADLEAQLDQARRSEQRLAGRAELLAARVGESELLSHRLAADRDAAQAGFLRADAASEVERLTGDLTDAKNALEQAREDALAAVVAPGLAGLNPSFAGDYVFPVGGGPGAISVAHDHHDYPAADIAAPHGAPLFALTDGNVVDAWPEGNGNCGIGFTLQAGDGRQWTYCHMSALDTAVAAGMAVAAGTPVGLVGSTGHSTGPHLHLQLQPAIAYPQDEPWFQALAGTAFSWQDTPRSDAPRVFALVDEPAAIEFSRGPS